MTVEIFSVAGTDGSAARTTGNSIRLDATSDVYFGNGEAGIAYYEKAGRDLKVTLLDGQEVLIRNFFVVDQEGGVSRLLLEPGGQVEVTGLLAPEPFVPLDEQTETPEPQNEIAEPDLEPGVGVGDSMGSDDPSGVPTSETAEGGLFGLSMGQVGIGLATAGVAAVSAGGFGDSDDDAEPASDSEAPALPAEPQEENEVHPKEQEDGATGLLAVIDRLLGDGNGENGDAGMEGGMFDEMPEEELVSTEPIEPAGGGGLAVLFDTDTSSEA